VSAKSTDKCSAETAASTAPGAVKDRTAPSGNSESRGEDVALVCGVSQDGEGLEIIRKRGERLETGTVRRLQSGKPIHGEVVRLRPRENAPLVCDVEVEVAHPQAAALAANSGPAQVATDNYRKNWEAIYGHKAKPSLMN
jgi:hypothetical protein